MAIQMESFLNKLTGIIDSPINILNSIEEILAWKKEVEAMPKSPQRGIALQEVDMLIRNKRYALKGANDG